MKPGAQPIPAEIRFTKYVRKTDNCWLWTGSKNRQGYGHLCIRAGLVVAAHRFAYQLAFGEFDPALYVCHKCDNPSCVNPDHLFLGTALDNMRDCIEKKRRKNHHGVTNGRAKLTEDNVREIRALHKQGMTQKAIAERFNVSGYPVWSVIHGVYWKHVE